MSELKFYHVSDKYVRFLHSGDNRVQHNKKMKRPYVGVVLSIQDIDYFVPLESPKENHKNIKNGGVVLKLDDGRLGVMGFNNMIPVRDVCLIPFNIEDVDNEKYKMLLYNQLHYCNRNKDIIKKRAWDTYKKQISHRIPIYNKICCNFLKLEKMCKQYDPHYKRKKKTP